MSSLVKTPNKIGNILASSGEKTTQKRPKMAVSTGTKTFEKLKLKNYISDIVKTQELYIRYCQNLLARCTTLTPFIYWKLEVSIKGRKHPEKPSKMPEIYQNVDFFIT